MAARKAHANPPTNPAMPVAMVDRDHLKNALMQAIIDSRKAIKNDKSKVTVSRPE
jgi:hypothetical protein